MFKGELDQLGQGTRYCGGDSLLDRARLPVDALKSCTGLTVSCTLPGRRGLNRSHGCEGEGL
jgi:hypothetical protein